MLSILIWLSLEQMDADEVIVREHATQTLTTLPWRLIREDIKTRCINGSAEVKSRARLVFWEFQYLGEWERFDEFGVDPLEGLVQVFNSQDAEWMAFHSGLPFTGANGVVLKTEEAVKEYWRSQVKVLTSNNVPQEAVVCYLGKDLQEHWLKGWKPKGPVYDFMYTTSNNYHAFVTLKDGRISGAVIW